MHQYITFRRRMSGTNSTLHSETVLRGIIDFLADETFIGRFKVLIVDIGEFCPSPGGGTQKLSSAEIPLSGISFRCW